MRKNEREIENRFDTEITAEENFGKALGINLIMIQFLYKILHYEPTPDHETNVRRSFLFINGIFSWPPLIFLYLIYKNIKDKNLLVEIVFLAAGSIIIASIYYFIFKKAAKAYIETDIGFKYYNFGRYNTVLKTLVVFLSVGFIIITSRIIIFLVGR